MSQPPNRQEPRIQQGDYSSGQLRAQFYRNYREANRWDGTSGQDYNRTRWDESRRENHSAGNLNANAGNNTSGNAQSFRGRAPKGYTRADERIHEDICERLMRDHHVDASDIVVEVKAGVVTLQGSVTERAQKYRAEELADNSSGVKGLHNFISLNRGQIQPAGGPSDTTQGASQSWQAGQATVQDNLDVNAKNTGNKQQS